MKIAILVWDLNITGGTQRQALELALNLQKLGHTVDVYCYVYDKNKCYTTLCDALNIISVKPGAQLQKTKNVKGERLIIKKIINLLHGYKNIVREIFKSDSEITELKRFIEKYHPLDYYDIINVHDYQVYKISRIVHHPHIIWMMNDIRRYPMEGGNILNRNLHNILQSILVYKETKNISRIIVLDKRNQLLAKKTYGVNATIIRSGVDLDMFLNTKLKRDYNHQIWTIFASSVFFPYRRFEDLVDAIEILVKKNITNISVTINGLPDYSYEYYLSIKERINKKNLGKNIAIVTGMSESQLKEQYSKSDIFVFPNKNQTWGLAVFEAMLAGCACIVSKGAGAHEVLTDKENAILVNPLSPLEIAAAIEALIKNPLEMRRVSENGSLFVRENLSWGKYTSQMLSVFKNEI